MQDSTSLYGHSLPVDRRSETTAAGAANDTSSVSRSFARETLTVVNGLENTQNSKHMHNAINDDDQLIPYHQSAGGPMAVRISPADDDNNNTNGSLSSTATGARSRGCLSSFSLPLWIVLCGQCVLVVAIFVALITSFTLQMEHTIEDQVQQRVTARLATVRESLLKPFQVGYSTAEQLAITLLAAPSTNLVADSATFANDSTFLRTAGAMVSTTSYVTYAAQMTESPTRVDPRVAGGTAKAITILVADKQMNIKVWGNEVYLVLGRPAHQCDDAVYARQPVSTFGTFTFQQEQLIYGRMGDGNATRYWTNYPVTGSIADQESVALTSVYSIAYGGPDANGGGGGTRFYHKNMVFVLIDLASAQPILKGLVDGGDSFASLYDIFPNATESSVEAGSGIVDTKYRTLIATTYTGARIITDDTMFYPAHASPVPALNSWYGIALADSAATGSEEGSVRHEKRFISYAHIRLNTDLHLFAVVSTAESRYFADQVELRNTMIIVGVVCAVVVVLLCVAVMIAIKKPISALIYNMGVAAQLKNEMVRPTSAVLSEIDVLCATFDRMNAMLMAARAFMPASLLMMGNTDNDDDDDDDDEEGFDDFDDDDDEGDIELVAIGRHTNNRRNRINNDGGGGGGPLGSKSRSSSFYTSTDDANTVNTASASDRHTKRSGKNATGKAKGGGGGGGLRRQRSNLTDKSRTSTVRGVGGAHNEANAVGGPAGGGALSIKHRRVGILVVNVRGFTNLSDFAISSLGPHATRLTELMSAVVAAERGIIDSFHGDHFVISFNAIRAVGAPGKRAVTCSFAINSALRDTPYCRLSMGASCGPAMCGPLGSHSQRRLSIVGSCYVKAGRLQRASDAIERSVDPLFSSSSSSSNNNNNSSSAVAAVDCRPAINANCFNCLIDAATYSECKDSVYTMLVGTLPTHQKATVPVSGSAAVRRENSGKIVTRQQLGLRGNVNGGGGGTTHTTAVINLASINAKEGGGRSSPTNRSYATSRSEGGSYASRNAPHPHRSGLTTTIIGVPMESSYSPLPSPRGGGERRGISASGGGGGPLGGGYAGGVGVARAVSNLTAAFPLARSRSDYDLPNGSLPVGTAATLMMRSESDNNATIFVGSSSSNVNASFPANSNNTTTTTTRVPVATIITPPAVSVTAVPPSTNTINVTAQQQQQQQQQQKVHVIPSTFVYAVAPARNSPSAAGGGGGAGGAGAGVDEEAADEWMYELLRHSGNDPFKLISRAVEGALRGDAEEVLKALKERIDKAVTQHSTYCQQYGEEGTDGTAAEQQQASKASAPVVGSNNNNRRLSLSVSTRQAQMMGRGTARTAFAALRGVREALVAAAAKSTTNNSSGAVAAVFGGAVTEETPMAPEAAMGAAFMNAIGAAVPSASFASHSNSASASASSVAWEGVCLTSAASAEAIANARDFVDTLSPTDVVEMAGWLRLAALVEGCGGRLGAPLGGAVVMA